MKYVSQWLARTRLSNEYMGEQSDELRYVYQRIGFQCFEETMFEDAGTNFINGDLDPRLLVSYYPDLRGSLFGAEDALDVFAGVAERMPSDASVDDISEYTLPHPCRYRFPHRLRPRLLSTHVLCFMCWD